MRSSKGVFSFFLSPGAKSPAVTALGLLPWKALVFCIFMMTVSTLQLTLLSEGSRDNFWILVCQGEAMTTQLVVDQTESRKLTAHLF